MFDEYDSDRVGSDDMEQVLELSRTEARKARSNSNSRPASSRQPSSSLTANGQMNGASLTPSEPAFIQKQKLNGRLNKLETEISEVERNIKDYQELRSRLGLEKQEIEKQLRAVQPTRLGAAVAGASEGSSGSNAGKARQNACVDYGDESLFDWSHELKVRMKSVFDIANFRLCQQGVCNANMDGRDIVCVMPTGGGKSLTYQLPALLTPGCTLVISPLISLITDQMLHLREAGVDAVMLTGATLKSDLKDTTNRLIAMASAPSNGREIKLVYVTPEKIAKNKHFLSILEKLANSGKLARVVIDEAHCVSQLGHDYRPDYKKLSMLRQLFPRVPILALSATCPDKVLQDLLQILSMKQTVDGRAAPKDGTVYFSAPLYRKNLHYSVLPKPSASKKVLELMLNYIIKNHKHDSGIIYCLRKKDTEEVAKQIYEISRHQIKTGVYHADVPDKQKEDLHVKWRKGEIKVVCATIAFGLGIDKGNVRFVLHHSMSKSLDGFYQESGRAGRDGQDADCVLYYRPQDATTLSAMMLSESQSQRKLHSMLSFAQDMHECRKIQFAKYFSVSSDLAMASWTTEDSDALARCGHCDNCTRSPESVEQKDVTLEAWQILKIAEAVKKDAGRLTLNALVDLSRGAGGGSYDVTTRGERKAKDKASIDLSDVAGGKINMSKTDIETVIVQLMLSSYLGESYSQTAYSTNVYVIPGQEALRLTRYTRQDIENNKGTRIRCSFRKAVRKSKAVTGTIGILNDSDAEIEVSDDANPVKAKVIRKRKRPSAVVDEVVENSEGEEDVEDFTEQVCLVNSTDSDDDWIYSMKSRPNKRPRKRNKRKRPSLVVLDDDEDIMTLSSD